jgi:hypothetical protein
MARPGGSRRRSGPIAGGLDGPDRPRRNPRAVVDPDVPRYDGAMKPPTIKHVRYEDFIALSSEGVGTLEGFRSAVDTLVGQMGDVSFHHVLIDLRHAVIPPLPEAVLIEALEHLRRRGLGVLNRVAIAIDRDDAARTLRLLALEQIAGHMRPAVRGFTAPIMALE